MRFILLMVIMTLFVVTLYGQRSSFRGYYDFSYFDRDPLPERVDNNHNYIQAHLPSFAMQFESEKSYYFQLQTGGYYKEESNEGSGFERYRLQFRGELGRHVRQFKEGRYNLNFATAITTYSQFQEVVRDSNFTNITRTNQILDLGIIFSAVIGLEYNLTKRILLDGNFDIFGFAVDYQLESRNNGNGTMIPEDSNSVDVRIGRHGRLRLGIGYRF